MLIKGKVYTTKTIPNYDGPKTLLRHILEDEEVTDDFFIVDRPLKTVKTILNKEVLTIKSKP